MVTSLDNTFSGLPQGFNAPEPKTPEETAARTDGWAKLQQTLSDPTMQMTMIRMGLAMMQPVPVGQSTGGHIASGIGYGLDYLEAKRAQEFKQQQEAQRTQSIIGLEGAQTAESQARTTQTIPAQAEASRAQTARLKLMTPLEVDQLHKNLVLLDYNIKAAPDELTRKRLETEKAQLNLQLEQQYGAADRKASLAYKNNLAGYYSALAAATTGLESQRKEKAKKESMIKWKPGNVQQDKENPYHYVVGQSAENGSQRLVSVMLPMPATEAAAQAKQEVKAYTDEQLRARFPNMTREQAQSAIADSLMKKRVEVLQITGPGGEILTGEAAQAGGAPQWDTGEKIPVPPAMENEPDGTSVVRNKDGVKLVKYQGSLIPQERYNQIKGITPGGGGTSSVGGGEDLSTSAFKAAQLFPASDARHKELQQIIKDLRSAGTVSPTTEQKIRARIEELKKQVPEGQNPLSAVIESIVQGTVEEGAAAKKRLESKYGQ